MKSAMALAIVVGVSIGSIASAHPGSHHDEGAHGLTHVLTQWDHLLALSLTLAVVAGLTVLWRTMSGRRKQRPGRGT